jgi:hypothetical protein
MLAAVLGLGLRSRIRGGTSAGEACIIAAIGLSIITRVVERLDRAESLADPVVRGVFACGSETLSAARNPKEPELMRLETAFNKALNRLLLNDGRPSPRAMVLREMNRYLIDPDRVMPQPVKIRRQLRGMTPRVSLEAIDLRQGRCRDSHWASRDAGELDRTALRLDPQMTIGIL